MIKLDYSDYSEKDLKKLNELVSMFNGNDKKNTRSSDLIKFGYILGLQFGKSAIYEYCYSTQKFVKVGY